MPTRIGIWYLVWSRGGGFERLYLGSVAADRGWVRSDYGSTRSRRFVLGGRDNTTPFSMFI